MAVTRDRIARRKAEQGTVQSLYEDLRYIRFHGSLESASDAELTGALWMAAAAGVERSVALPEIRECYWNALSLSIESSVGSSDARTVAAARSIQQILLSTHPSFGQIVDIRYEILDDSGVLASRSPKSLAYWEDRFLRTVVAPRANELLKQAFGRLGQPKASVPTISKSSARFNSGETQNTSGLLLDVAVLSDAVTSWLRRAELLHFRDQLYTFSPPEGKTEILIRKHIAFERLSLPLQGDVADSETYALIAYGSLDLRLSRFLGFERREEFISAVNSPLTAWRADFFAVPLSPMERSKLRGLVGKAPGAKLEIHEVRAQPTFSEILAVWQDWIRSCDRTCRVNELPLPYETAMCSYHETILWHHKAHNLTQKIRLSGILDEGLGTSWGWTAARTQTDDRLRRLGLEALIYDE